MEPLRLERPELKVDVAGESAQRAVQRNAAPGFQGTAQHLHPRWTEYRRGFWTESDCGLPLVQCVEADATDDAFGMALCVGRKADATHDLLDEPSRLGRITRQENRPVDPREFRYGLAQC